MEEKAKSCARAFFDLSFAENQLRAQGYTSQTGEQPERGNLFG